MTQFFEIITFLFHILFYKYTLQACLYIRTNCCKMKFCSTYIIYGYIGGYTHCKKAEFIPVLGINCCWWPAKTKSYGFPEPECRAYIEPKPDPLTFWNWD